MQRGACLIESIFHISDDATCTLFHSKSLAIFAFYIAKYEKDLEDCEKTLISARFNAIFWYAIYEKIFLFGFILPPCSCYYD